MIEFTETALNLSLDVCKALIAFASKDKTRPHLYSIGFNEGNVCATDGHGAVRFQKHTGSPGSELLIANRVFPLDYVKERLAIAKAQKSATVSLEWDKLSPDTVRFPPVNQVEPTNHPKHIKVVPYAPVGFNAELFAKLVYVQKACTDGNRRAHLQPSKLVDVSGPLEPIMFEVGSHSTGCKSLHFARVTVMPVRIEYPGQS